MLADEMLFGGYRVCLTGVCGKELDFDKERWQLGQKRLRDGDKAEEQGRVHDFVGGGDV
jgi:hypothetical protein